MSDLVKLESLPVETLAEMANEAAAACEASGRKTVEHAATCGRALLAIRPQIPHGEWLDWLKENFSQSQVRAHQYMEIANYNRGYNLDDATSIREALRLIADSPEKRAKKAEREAKKLETSPKPLAPATPAPPVTAEAIRHEAPPAPQSQPERPAWLADPDEMVLPLADDLPPLPKTNTHHTAANRREPDARETDRIGLVTIDDPRDYVDGAWYEFDEASGRLFAVTHDQILQRAAQVMAIRSREASVAVASVGGAPTTDSRDTKKVAERECDTKRFVRPTVAEVAAYAREIGAAIDAEQFCDFYTAKDWMIGKNKMKDWKAAVRTWKRGQAAKPGTAENGKVRSANWEDDGTGWEDLRDG